MKCLRTLFLCMGLCLTLPSVQCQSESPCIHAEVGMEAHGFMCPFLTPMFLGFLEDKGAHWVQHDPDASTVEFAMPLDSLQGTQDLTDRLVLIGFDARQVSYNRYDTLMVVPPNPEP